VRIFASLVGSVALAWVLIPGPYSQAQTPLEAPPEDWSLHGQVTGVVQYHPSFRSSYQGANSLDPGNSGRETMDLTLYAGVRLWEGGQLFVNPEIDQGFGLSNTLGVAAFPSGEAYKVGASDPYFRLPRLFLRQTFALGPDVETVGPGANQLAGPQPVDSLVLTGGKFSLVDLFDTNRYAHDPRTDFLNWAVIESGAFDYPADAWGYSYGAAVEWNQSNWTARFGTFALSRVPNSRELDRGFGQFALIGELERRYAWDGRPGKLKLLGFANHGLMGRYDDALARSRTTGAIPDTSLVRQTLSRAGFALNLEQELGADLGLFARASINDGGKEAFEFTEINRSISLGLSLKGHRWRRSEDTVGLALVINGLSTAARDYFDAGGLGILIGDGALRYGTEKIAEAYYAWQVAPHWTVAANYQYIDHPAYNRDRGPVSVPGARLHVDY
jgi:high affinity Mn2+ porin